MNTNCKSCGAAAKELKNAYSFVCEYCGSNNVDDLYLKEYAKVVESTSTNKSLQLGLIALKSDDYSSAEKQFEAAVSEDPNSGDAWLYLAYCKSALIKPSNFDKNFLFAKNCIDHASKLIATQDISKNGTVLVANRFLSSAKSASNYYIDTGKKKFIAFGGSSQAKTGASDEYARGLRLIRDAYSLGANDSKLMVDIFTFGYVQCLDFKKEIGSSKDLESLGQFFEEQLGLLFKSHAEAVRDSFSLNNKFRSDLNKLIDKWSKSSQPPKITPSKGSDVQATSEQHVSSGATRNMVLLLGGFGVVGAGLAVFALGGIGGASVPSAPVVSPAPVAAQAPATQVPSIPVAPADAPQPAAPESTPPVVAAVSSPVVDPVRTVSAGFKVLAPDESKDLLTAMLVQSSSAFQLAELKSQIELLPKPSTGDRKAARKLNDQGLSLLKGEKIPEAVDLLRQAVEADPADIEVKNNYAYSLIKAAKYADAENHVGKLLTQAPGRSSGWANLAEIYAATSRETESSSALVIAFQFSGNKDKTIVFLKEKIADPTSPLKGSAQKALERIEKM